MPEPKVIYEDSNFIAVNKPAGLLTHPFMVRAESVRKKIKQPTLAGWIRERYPETGRAGDNPEMRPGMAHRLDRETSGIILIARNQNYFEYLKSLFKSRLIKKTYWVLCLGKLAPKEGIIDKPIGLVEGTTRRSVVESKGRKLVKEAVTEYKVDAYLEDSEGNIFSEVWVYPRTGRTHQIRVHMAGVGCPIVGDPLYGKKTLKFNTRLMLHAAALEWNPYPNKRLKLEAELPEGCVKFKNSLTSLIDG